jgi:hypothetical protein
VLKSDIPKKGAVKPEPTEDTVAKKTGETFSMEERMNPKDFQKISSIKLTSRDDTLEW